MTTTTTPSAHHPQLHRRRRCCQVRVDRRFLEDAILELRQTVNTIEVEGEMTPDATDVYNRCAGLVKATLRRTGLDDLFPTL